MEKEQAWLRHMLLYRCTYYWTNIKEVPLKLQMLVYVFIYVDAKSD